MLLGGSDAEQVALIQAGRHVEQGAFLLLPRIGGNAVKVFIGHPRPFQGREDLVPEFCLGGGGHVNTSFIFGIGRITFRFSLEWPIGSPEY